MPRMGRIVLPNYPHHVVQRGHNRQVVFAGESDFRRYLDDILEFKSAFGVRVYTKISSEKRGGTKKRVLHSDRKYALCILFVS